MKENLQGKVCLITGATNGIGEEAAKQIALMGAEIVFIARSPAKAEELKQSLKSLTGRESTSIIADLSSQEEVKRAASEFLSMNKPLNILLNNAGIMNTSRKETVDGLEEVFSVNHLAYYSFTLMLMNKLIESGPSRVVNVASGAHMFVKDMNFDDLQSEKEYKTMQVYGRSKLANILFTRELAERLKGKGVTVNCLHPGFVNTGIGSNNSPTMGRILMTLARPFSRKTDKGAETSIYLCVSPEVENETGEYFYDCKKEKISAAASDKENATKLWEVSSKLTGIDLLD
jgi:retinol dehydrogenase-12|tara:strand:- start:2178 stop:3041 length:864 start_codon:yes stop_codon:yes gene_type:complete